MSFKPVATSLAFIAVCIWLIPTASAHQYRRYTYRTYHYHSYKRPKPRKKYNNMLGIGIRAGGMLMEGTKFNLSNLENPSAGSIGVQFRSKFTSTWGIEFAVDYVRGKKEGLLQQTIPITLSLLYYFLPNSRIQPFLLAGTGVHFTKMTYTGGIRRDLTEVIGQVGGGVEIRIGRSFSINAGVRGLFVWKMIGNQVSLPTNCTNGSGTCTGIKTIKTDDKFNFGVQFLAGVNYYF